MTKSEILREQKKAKKRLNDRVLHGEKKLMGRPLEQGGAGFHYSVIIRFLDVDNSFYSKRVEAGIEQWLDKRDASLTLNSTISQS